MLKLDLSEQPRNGWLAAFLPYIRTRAGIPTPLGPLPVREDFQKLFEGWARRMINLTYSEPAEAVGESADT